MFPLDSLSSIPSLSPVPLLSHSNWSNAYKWYITFLVVMAAFCCNLTNAGPSIAIIQTAMEFQVMPTKAAYLFSAAAFAQGLASFLWAPLVGRTRPASSSPSPD